MKPSSDYCLVIEAMQFTASCSPAYEAFVYVLSNAYDALIAHHLAMLKVTVSFHN